MDLSVRQAVTPTGNWIVHAWEDTTHVIQVNGMNQSVGDFSQLFLFNPGPATVSVFLEYVDTNGATLRTASLTVAARATVRVSSQSNDQATLLIRCPSPIYPGARRFSNGIYTALPALPMSPV